MLERICVRLAGGTADREHSIEWYSKYSFSLYGRVGSCWHQIECGSAAHLC